MISRTSILAALFAVFTTAALAGAAEYQTRKVDAIAAAAAATTVATAQLPTVVVTARRIAAHA